MTHTTKLERPKMNFDLFMTKILDKFNEPKQAMYISWCRFIIFGFFGYRLLCSDFSIFAMAPASSMENYPWKIYLLKDGFAFLGIKYLVDLTSFHWLHWFFAFPSVNALANIQFASFISCCLVLLFGRGPKNLFAIFSYCGIAYLWGFMWRTEADIDSVFILMQLGLIYCFLKEPEALTLRRQECQPLQFTEESGWFYSMTLLVFIGYYFGSGLHKLTDITLIGWFEMDLLQIIQRYYQLSLVNAYNTVPPLLHYLSEFTFLNYIMTPAVYLSHLTIPYMFFKRRLIATYFFFYIIFHYFTFGVGILFPGLLVAWLVFLPVHRFFSPIVVVWDSKCALNEKIINIFKGKNRFGLAHLINSTEASNDPNALDQNWTEEKGLKAIWAKSPGSSEEFYGFYALRRITWTMPRLWPLLFVLYLPLVPQIGQMLYQWTLNTGHRFSHEENPY